MKENPDNLLPAVREGLYPIRIVSEKTGVNAITLRAWERRYGLFKPARTPKGHRLYSQKDIQRIQQVLQLLDQGIAIGQVAKTLKNQAERTAVTPLASPNDLLRQPEQYEVPSDDQWQIYYEKVLGHINAFDIAPLEQLHHEVFSLYPLELMSRRLICPLIQHLRHQAEQLHSLSASYHFYQQFIQQRLGGLFLRSTLHNHGKKLLLMGYGDSQATVELMLFGLPLLTHGYQVVSLGGDMPFDALPMMLLRSNSDALILYAAPNQQHQPSEDAAHYIDSNIASILAIKTVADSVQLPIFIVGEQTKQQEDLLSTQGLWVLTDNVTEQLQMIDTQLNKHEITTR